MTDNIRQHLRAFLFSFIDALIPVTRVSYQGDNFGTWGKKKSSFQQKVLNDLSQHEIVPKKYEHLLSWTMLLKFLKWQKTSWNVDNFYLSCTVYTHIHICFTFWRTFSLSKKNWNANIAISPFQFQEVCSSGCLFCLFYVRHLTPLMSYRVITCHFLMLLFTVVI